MYFFLLRIVCPLCETPLLDGPLHPPSSRGSHTCGVIDLQIPSLYQFSTVDATSAVDYFRDVDINDGVLNNLPPKIVACTYTPLPSLLSKDRQMLVRLGHVSPSRDDVVNRHGLSQHLRMEAPWCDLSPVDSVLPPANLSAIVSLPCLDSPQLLNNATIQSTPDAPLDALVMPIVPDIDLTKANVPFFVPCPFFTIAFLLSLHVGNFTSAYPKPPSLFFPLHFYFYLLITLFYKWFPTRLVAGPPQLLHWMGTPSKSHLPSLIVIWPSEEVQDVPSCKRPHIPLTIPPRTIR